MKAARKPREPKPEKAAAATAVPADLYWLWEFRFDRLFEAGELDKALAESNRAIEQHGDGEAYTARALVYGAMGWVNEGIADCDRAPAVDPGYGAAYVVKGRFVE